MKRFLLGATALLGLHAAAFAGHFTLVTSSVYFNYPATAWLYHNTASTPSVLGTTYSLDLTSGPVKPYHSGAINGFTAAYVDAYMQVKWVEDYPGEPHPTPNTQPASWSVTQLAHCQLGGLLSVPGSALVGVIGTFATDPNAYSFNQFFTETTVLNYPSATVNNVSDGSFLFAQVGSDWVGDGVFRISLEISGNGTIPAPEGGGVGGHLYESNTLTSIGGYSVY